MDVFRGYLQDGKATQPAYMYRLTRVFAVFTYLGWLLFGLINYIVIHFHVFFRKPTALLRGHSAPIFFLLIAEEENRIFSLSTDKCIKVKLNLMKSSFHCLCCFVRLT